MTLQPLEKHRIEEIIEAVEAADWDRFKFLSDAPFSNESSMKEQFDDSRTKVVKGFGNWERDVKIRKVEDGTRLLFLHVENRVTPNKPIILTIHNAHGQISVWTFYEQFEI